MLWSQKRPSREDNATQRARAEKTNKTKTLERMATAGPIRRIVRDVMDDLVEEVVRELCGYNGRYQDIKARWAMRSAWLHESAKQNKYDIQVGNTEIKCLVEEGSLSGRFRGPDCIKCGASPALCQRNSTGVCAAVEAPATPERTVHPDSECRGSGYRHMFSGDRSKARAVLAATDPEGKVDMTMKELQNLVDAAIGVAQNGQGTALTLTRDLRSGAITAKHPEDSGLPDIEVTKKGKVWFPCDGCGKIGTRTGEGLEVAGTCECCKTKGRGGWCYERQWMDCVASTFSSSHLAHQRDADRRGHPVTEKTNLAATRRHLLFPALQDAHEISQQKMLDEYRAYYLSEHPNHVGPVPIALAMDGRWQKRWGWNSLDGHTMARVFSPDANKPLLAHMMRCYIAVVCYHRDSPGGTERNVPEKEAEDDLHDGPASGIVPHQRVIVPRITFICVSCVTCYSSAKKTMKMPVLRDILGKDAKCGEERHTAP
jgi:hypothetical protein